MKTWLIPAVALSLLLATPTAFAAPRDQNTATQQDRHRTNKTDVDRSHRSNADSDRRDRRDVIIRRNDHRDRNVIVRPPVRVDRDRHRDRNFDRRTYQGNFNSSHRYRYHTYRRPHGWYNHHWGYGERLPRGWYGRDYWILDFMMFGLMQPPYGYVWVRVGDDALLIDEETGEVVRVVYNVFY